MKLFLSWSGERGQNLASAMRSWLPDVLQGIEPWISARDIERGARWASTLASELASTDAGIICITPESQHEPWLQFEAGALSKAVDESLVAPLLLGMQKADLTGPLQQFQATLATKREIRDLVRSLNRACGVNALDDRRVGRAFDHWWPELERAIDGIEASTGRSRDTPKPKRPLDEMLEEVLLIVRRQERAGAVESGPSTYSNLFGGALDTGKVESLAHQAVETLREMDELGGVPGGNPFACMLLLELGWASSHGDDGLRILAAGREALISESPQDLEARVRRAILTRDWT